jgi:hypothetical protein
MNLYNQDELDRIQKTKDTNDRLEELFNDKRAEWNKQVEPLFKALTTDLFESIQLKIHIGSAVDRAVFQTADKREHKLLPEQEKQRNNEDKEA